MRTLTLTLAAALFLAVPSLIQPARGQDGGFTASERLQAANRDYNAGNWEAAATAFTQFIKDFGGRPETAPVIPKLRFPIAQCYLQLRKFPEALTAIDEALHLNPPLATREIQTLHFNKTICLAQEEKFAEARSAVAAFLALFPREVWKQPSYLAQFPTARNVPESQLLYGTCFVLESKHKDAADYFAKLKPSLSPINRGRASVLELYALLQINDLPRALDLIRTEFPRMEENVQIATFQTLVLEVGALFLDKGENRNAIACFSRLWGSARLIQHQEKRLAEFEAALANLNATPHADPGQRHLVAQLATKIRSELAAFRKIPNFDSAARLRLATAYQAMDRFRESALILENMLETLPADSVVEQASVALVQCWGQIERWPKVVSAAEGFARKFPNSKSLPLVLYLRGTAHQRNFQFAEAQAVFSSLAQTHTGSEFAPRAVFMQGYTQLLADQPHDAIASFEAFQLSHPSHQLSESAAYWRVLAYSLDKQFARCRSVADEYLARYPKGENRGLTVFRKAYAAHSLRDYSTSVPEFNAYLRQFPGHESQAEALTLLADALMAGGNLEEGISALRRIPPSDEHFYEEGWFKIGKALKLLERYKDLQTHMESFAQDRPRSHRLAEAIYWVGWCRRQEGHPEQARTLYWETIRRNGDDPAMRSIDDLFPALATLYKGDEEKAQHLATLRDLREEALADSKKNLALRALWAQGRTLLRPDPAKAADLLAQGAALADVQTTNPLLLADFADALSTASHPDAATALWRDLLKWNPRAPQKDRALLALGQAEAAAGHEKAAMAFFERFENETAGSPLLSKAILARARLLEERGELPEMLRILDKLLADKTAPSQDKAQALFRIAEAQMRQKKPQQAIAYYQRIYVTYGRWRDLVAKAYLRSGEAFELLQDKEAARRTYEEFIANELLADQPERKEAQKRLGSL